MIPKHGKNSARSKKCAKYLAECRRARNKAKHIYQQEVFAGKQQSKREARKENEVGLNA